MKTTSSLYIDIKPEMLSVVQTGNGAPHGKYDIRGIAHACTNRKEDIHAKTTGAKLYIYNGVGTIDKAHMALNIFRFAAFFSICIKFSRFTID